jgi:hypothetical protein
MLAGRQGRGVSLPIYETAMHKMTTKMGRKIHEKVGELLLPEMELNGEK